MLLLRSSALGALLSVLGTVSCGEVTVSSVVSDTVCLPCWFPFVQGVDNLIAVWEKQRNDGKNVQIYKFVKGRTDLSTQDSQFRGRTNLTGDVSKGNLDLTISGVIMDDNGVYFCRAANIINHGDNTVILSVSAVPPQRIESVVGGEVTLERKSFGNPSELTWNFGTSKIVEKELVSPVAHYYRPKNKVILNPNGSLTIGDLRKEDTGVYKSQVLMKNFIYEAEIWLIVHDRVSKPTIADHSSSLQIVLICQSSTVNVTYRWQSQTSGEIVSAEQEYTAPRPGESVKLMCVVNNSVSEESESITIPSTSDIGPSARHYFIIIFIFTLVLGIVIIAVVVRCYKKCRKREKTYKDRSESSADYKDTGFQEEEDGRDATSDERISLSQMFSDSAYVSDAATEEDDDDDDDDDDDIPHS